MLRVFRIFSDWENIPALFSSWVYFYKRNEEVLFSSFFMESSQSLHKKRNHEWMRNGSKARCIFNVYMYRRSEHQSSNLKSNSCQLVTWRGQQAKDLVKKFKLFAIKALKINYQVTKNMVLHSIYVSFNIF